MKKENKPLFSSENPPVPIPNFYLKVNLSCCAACPRKAKTKLEKLYGVVAITIDREKGLMGVSGTVDPQILVQKMAKWGKKAELLSPVKDPKQNSHAKTQSNQKNNIQDPKMHQDCSSNLNWKAPLQNSYANTQVPKKEKEYSSQLDDSDSSGDHDLDCANNGNISWQHPDLLLNKIQKPKKPCWFLRLFCKRKSKGQSSGPKKQDTNFPRPLYSRMPMPGYGVPSPYYQLPPHGSQYYRPMMYGRMAAQPPFSYYQPRPPYGFLGSGPPPPPPPPQFNPMIHYTRYEDNYTHW